MSDDLAYVVLWETWDTSLQKFSYLMASGPKPRWTTNFENIGFFSERMARATARLWIDEVNRTHGSNPKLHILLYDEAIIKIAMET